MPKKKKKTNQRKWQLKVKRVLEIVSDHIDRPYRNQEKKKQKTNNRCNIQVDVDEIVRQIIDFTKKKKKKKNYEKYTPPPFWLITLHLFDEIFSNG